MSFMKYKKYLTWVYAIGALLIIAGVVMKVFMGIRFGSLLMHISFIFVPIYQGWVISKLSKEK